jgi:hypothetical protein
VKKPKAPKEDPSTIALREQQLVDLSRLDEEENRRVKELLVGQRGGRFFRGAPSMRARPSDRAGAPGRSASPGAPSMPGPLMGPLRPRAGVNLFDLR